jgi:RNA 2',3'-cyclic 3'-phosphodiesterase
MRLFTAVELTPEILLRLERLQTSLRPEAFIKWSPLDNLHITTKFIGEWPESRLDELYATLEALAPREPFDVELKDLGWFPNERSPRVLWVGVHGEGALENLAHSTEDGLTKIGIAKEERPFAPHLTLARIKHPVPLDRLRERVKEMQSVSLGAFAVTRFALFRSDPGSNSSIYRKLRTYPFQSARAAS